MLRRTLEVLPEAVQESPAIDCVVETNMSEQNRLEESFVKNCGSTDGSAIEKVPRQCFDDEPYVNDISQHCVSVTAFGSTNQRKQTTKTRN